MVTRALVLSGGGPVGIAWELGIAAGLEQEGLRLADADFIVGTSAGSFAGARLASGRSAKLVAEAFLEIDAPAPAEPPNLVPLRTIQARAADESHSPEALLAEIGAFALNAPTVSEDAFIQSMGLAGEVWPLKRFACTAGDACDGSFRVWDNDSGVPLALAVASSSAMPGRYPPVTLGGRRYFDGGMRSGWNADLARGYGRVLIISVQRISVLAMGPMAELRQRRRENELNALREGGSEVEVLEPDDASASTIGIDVSDFRNRDAAMVTGLRQGRLEAERLRPFWG